MDGYLAEAIIGLIIGAVAASLITILVYRNKTIRERMALESENHFVVTQINEINDKYAIQLGLARELEKKIAQYVDVINALEIENAMLETRIDEERNNSGKALKTILAEQEALVSRYSTLSEKSLEEKSRLIVKRAVRLLENYRQTESRDADQIRKGINDLAEMLDEKLGLIREHLRQMDSQLKNVSDESGADRSEDVPTEDNLRYLPGISGPNIETGSDETDRFAEDFEDLVEELEQEFGKLQVAKSAGGGRDD